MAVKRNLEADLLALAAMPDSEIDTTDIPETTSFENAEIGRYSDIDFRGYDIRSIANWVIYKARRENVKISNLWLNKFVFFLFERALILKNVLLTPARVEAWEFGPVFRELYFNFPSEAEGVFSRFNVKKRQREVAAEPFEVEDLQVFEQVWDELGHKTASQLTTLSHRPGSPWHAIWEQGGSVNPGMVIDIDTILGRDADQGHGNS